MREADQRRECAGLGKDLDLAAVPAFDGGAFGPGHISAVSTSCHRRVIPGADALLGPARLGQKHILTAPPGGNDVGAGHR